MAWAFTEPYRRDPLTLWGGRVMHPEYKGTQEPRRFRRRLTVPEVADVRVRTSAPAPVTVDVPERLEPGEHVVEAFVGATVHPGAFACEIELEMTSGTAVIRTDDRWETAGPGEPWHSAMLVSMAGPLGHDGSDETFPPLPRRSPLLDVAWLEGEDSVAGHAADGWADTPEAPPPAWFCFRAPPGARAMTVPVRGDVQAWVDGEAVPMVDGRLALREHARVALRVQAPADHRGAACFGEHPVLELGPGTIPVGTSWHRLGLDCFSGVVVHRATVTVDEGGPAILDLGRVAGSVAVRVNDVEVGTLAWAPWRLAVTLVAGVNTVELEVANTLGPLAARGIPTPFGPEDQRTSGLLERPRLLRMFRS